MSGSREEYDPNSFYPSGTLYSHLSRYRTTQREDEFWHYNLSSALDELEEKLDSPRLSTLAVDILWHSGFEDREFKRLQRSLLALRVLLDDMQLEEKELQLWKTQHRYLKDLLCELDDALNDIALRAPQLKQLLQSQPDQFSRHPYVAEKLGQINRLIQELNAIAAEIKSVVLLEFNTRWPNTSVPTFHGNQDNAIARSSQAPNPSDVSSMMETLTLHFATLTTSLSRVEDRLIRVERKQETSDENMRRLYESRSPTGQMSRPSPPPPPPPRETDSSDSE